MKYLLLLLIVAIGVWMLTAKSRRRRRADEPVRPGAKPATPQAMLSCAHCGLHLPATDALVDGARVYCSDAHRRLGPRSSGEH